MDAEQLRILSDKSLEKGRYYEAVEDAYKYIIRDSDMKMKQAAKQGYKRAYLYTWEFTENHEDKTNCFKDVRMLDLVKKSNLIEKLNKYFNPNLSRDGLHVHYHSFNNLQKSGTSTFSKRKNPTRYGLYVSWSLPRENQDNENVKENQDHGEENMVQEVEQ